MKGKQENQLLELLFRTNAVRVCEEEKPFWYTSGTIGPFYINTHFLFGSEQKAEELLRFIEANLADREGITKMVLERLLSNYREDAGFRSLMDILVQSIQSANLPEEYVVSGGERRDWFFSILAAHLLKKPHVTIFKNLDAVVFYEGEISTPARVAGQNVVHIADLVTEASSYERAWIPAVKKLKGKMISTFVIVDRMQGGREFLSSHGVELSALISIDGGFFQLAKEHGFIDAGQLEMILSYQKDPIMAMRTFLVKHPEFIEQALHADEKTSQRAQLLVKKDFYNLYSS